jgi:hypothetical protein
MSAIRPADLVALRHVGSPDGRNAAPLLVSFFNHPFSRYHAMVSRISSTGRNRIPSACSLLRWSKRVRSRSRAINRTVARLMSAGRPLTRAQTSFAASDRVEQLRRDTPSRSADSGQTLELLKQFAHLHVSSCRDVPLTSPP